MCRPSCLSDPKHQRNVSGKCSASVTVVSVRTWLIELEWHLSHFLPCQSVKTIVFMDPWPPLHHMSKRDLMVMLQDLRGICVCSLCRAPYALCGLWKSRLCLRRKKKIQISLLNLFLLSTGCDWLVLSAWYTHRHTWSARWLVGWYSTVNKTLLSTPFAERRVWPVSQAPGWPGKGFWIWREATTLTLSLPLSVCLSLPLCLCLSPSLSLSLFLPPYLSVYISLFVSLSPSHSTCSHTLH